MKLVLSFWALTIILFCFIGVFADSPITSTPFASVYSEEKIMVATNKAKGIITPELIEYLSKKENPVELKMAVINQLGWHTKIKDNGKEFFRYLVIKNHYKNDDEFLEKATADELLSMAYLLAMDDYQDVAPAIKFADLALQKNPNSLTFNLVVGLIKAQKAMDGDWCEIYKIINNVRQNSELTSDMKSDATKIIYQYTDSYKEFCK